MAVTQQNIAERLNISRSLVARVLSDTPGVRVSADTRRRILHTAKEIGYRPNTAARSLRTGRTNTVTFAHLEFGPNRVNHSYMAAIEAFARELGKIDYELKLKVPSTSADMLSSLRDMASSRSTDAVILWSSEEDTEVPGLLLQEFDFPFVVKGRLELNHPTWLQADFDHEQMMAIAIGEMAGSGHRRIAYFGYDTDALFSQRLLAGYRQAVMRCFGAPPADELIAEVGPSPVYAEAKTQEWLSLPTDRRPTAIVIGTGDQTWLGVEKALARRGRRIGQGQGEIMTAGLASRSLNTMFGQGRCFYATDLGILATEMVNRLLAPLLEGANPADTIVRICPKLESTNELNLTEIVDFRS